MTSSASSLSANRQARHCAGQQQPCALTSQSQAGRRCSTLFRNGGSSYGLQGFGVALNRGKRRIAAGINAPSRSGGSNRAFLAVALEPINILALLTARRRFSRHFEQFCFHAPIIPTVEKQGTNEPENLDALLR